MLLLSYWKEVLIALLLTALGAGYYMWPEPIPPTVITKEVEVVKHEVQYVDRVTTITKNPDGTETTTIVDKTVTDTKEKEKESDKVNVSSVSKYSVGVNYTQKDMSTKFDYKSIGLDIGYRLGNTPFEITLGGNPWKKEATAGVRINW